MRCDKPAIRAHSVQNARAMDLISEADHVYGLSGKLVDREPNAQFTRLSRNKASTFCGLCNSHDTEIFKQIDTRPIDLKDSEQLFLISYRSIIKELHALMEGGIRTQKAYNDGVKQGRVPANQMNEAMMVATSALVRGYEAYQFRVKFYDLSYLRQKFRTIQHSVFVIENRAPMIAASSTFSVKDRVLKKDPLYLMTLNLIPLSETQTAVIASYPDQYRTIARKYLAPVFANAGRDQLYELSYLIINRAENFFMKPSVVESWTPERRGIIEREFFATAGLPIDAPRLPELMLFD